MRLSALSLVILALTTSLASAESDAPVTLPQNAARSELAISESVLSISEETSVISESIAALEGASQDLQQARNDVTANDASQLESIEGISVTETEKEITIDLSSDILFDFNKWSIRADASKALTAVEKVLSKHPKADINLEGHTDSVGSDRYNKELSMKRALSVREWFIENGDIPARRFKPIGLGETRPAAPNAHPDGSDNPEGRQKNRRVTIVVQK
jgi:outer membrane protein OmpA-like peptidoglycan-associated protein